MKNRYENLYKIINKIKPRVILEVGTHNGNTARKMVKQSEKHYPNESIIYYGFDLWEELTPEVKEYEHCGKPTSTIRYARENLDKTNCQLKFYQGNTKITLKAFAKESDVEFVDFAFIDGGHSAATIKSDWENVRKVMKVGGVVVFDDFYTWPPGKEDYTIGCNTLITDIIIEYMQDVVTYLQPLDIDPNSNHKIRMVRVDIR